MTDLEMTKLCAKAMKFKQIHTMGNLVTVNNGCRYDPLHDDEQAMALLFLLIEKGVVTVSAFGFKFRFDIDENPFIYHKIESPEILRRAIVECVAKMREAK